MAIRVKFFSYSGSDLSRICKGFRRRFNLDPSGTEFDYPFLEFRRLSDFLTRTTAVQIREDFCTTGLIALAFWINMCLLSIQVYR